MMTAKDISRTVGIREKEVYEHLPHVMRTLEHAGAGGVRLRFVVEPPVCLECGFSFKKRDRLKTPGKCPICKSEEITETRFAVVEE